MGAVGKYILLHTPLHKVYQNVITCTGAVGRYQLLHTSLHEVYQNVITCTGAVGKCLLLCTSEITCMGWHIVNTICLYIKTYHYV